MGRDFGAVGDHNQEKDNVEYCSIYGEVSDGEIDGGGISCKREFKLGHYQFSYEVRLSLNRWTIPAFFFPFLLSACMAASPPQEATPGLVPIDENTEDDRPFKITSFRLTDTDSAYPALIGEIRNQSDGDIWNAELSVLFRDEKGGLIWVEEVSIGIRNLGPLSPLNALFLRTSLG